MYQINQRENEFNAEIEDSYELTQENNNIKINTKINEEKINSKIREPKDGNSKVYIFFNTKEESSENISNNQLKTGLIEFENENYFEENKKIFSIGGMGMGSGEYKFIGEKILIKENISPNQKIEINQEEIMEELNKRKNKKKKKKITYEVVDKFYTLTNISGKTVKKLEKIASPGQKNYFYETLYTSNINPNINTQLNTKSQMLNGMPSDNYSRYFLSQINKLRTEPQSFIGVIEGSKSNIKKDRLGRLIYNGKIKVALSLGESAFNEAINYLKTINPMQPLIYRQDLTINPPLTIQELMDKDDLNKKVDIITHMGVNIRSFWRDVIKDPEISFLLMIIDDNGIKSGLRRKDILCPYMKYIGISSTEINNNFVCYVTLA